MNCPFCSTPCPGDQVYFRDACPACGRDLHVCRNCHFFDPHAHRQCRETVSETVPDKERANFCEHFRPVGIAQPASGPDSAAALSRLEALFKK